MTGSYAEWRRWGGWKLPTVDMTVDIMIAMTPPDDPHHLRSPGRPRGPVQLRRDLTPCLLYPQLLERSGGLTRAVIERASLYADHYEQVIIFTTSFSPRMPAILAELRRRLYNDEEAERAETVTALRDIALLRMDEVVR